MSHARRRRCTRRRGLQSGGTASPVRSSRGLRWRPSTHADSRSPRGSGERHRGLACGPRVRRRRIARPEATLTGEPTDPKCPPTARRAHQLPDDLPPGQGETEYRDCLNGASSPSSRSSASISSSDRRAERPKRRRAPSAKEHHSLRSTSLLFTAIQRTSKSGLRLDEGGLGANESCRRRRPVTPSAFDVCC